MTACTRDNIEDWDFRAWINPLHRGDADPIPDLAADLFLMDHFTEVLVVDHLRLHTLNSLLKGGFATLTDDKEDVLLTAFGASVLPHMTSWRDLFTSQGRLNRRVVKALVREWKKSAGLSPGCQKKRAGEHQQEEDE